VNPLILRLPERWQETRSKIRELLRMALRQNRGDLVAECGEEEAGQMLTAGLHRYRVYLIREFGKLPCRTL
jgi:hypothetical protein